MKLNEKRIVEVVLIILFPAALFAGCAGNGNEKPEIMSETVVNETMDNETIAIETQAYDSLVYQAQDKVLQNMVYFQTDQYTVQAEAESLLAQYASKLVSDPGAYLSINGHADERGGTDYNLNLSEQRAQEVEARLLSLGVPNTQLRTHSYGETMPAESLSDWQENRRVELEYTNAIVSTIKTNENSKESTHQLAEEWTTGPMVSQAP